MSQVASVMHREKVPAGHRGSMGKARRARILDAWGHKCAYPCCTETFGLELDHEIALDLGGKDDDANLRPLCRPHHAQKTKLDAKLIGKNRRLRDRENGTRRERKPIHGRPLQGGKFSTSLRKKMDGTVERRCVVPGVPLPNPETGED